MDLNDYFDPVSLPKPLLRNVAATEEFARRLTVHVPDQPIRDVGDFDVALLGVPEDRLSDNKGASEAPDHIRSKLYALSRLRGSLKIIDLGNMRVGNTPGDTQYGLEDILFHLLENEVIAIVLGGTQEITLPACRAVEKYRGRSRLVTLDARLDLSKGDDTLRSDNWLEELLDREGTLRSLGYQEYLVNPRDTERLQKHGHTARRLGRVREDLSDHEPCFRDTEVHSYDLSVVRMSDAPGTLNPSPNGLSGTEVCQLALYSGLSDRVTSFLVTEVNPRLDPRDQTAHLAAQMTWFFLSGLSRRTREQPDPSSEHFIQFILDLPATEEKITFLKSHLTNRWWFLSPVPDKVTGKKEWIPCSYRDYQMASHREIPERWFSLVQKS